MAADRPSLGDCALCDGYVLHHAEGPYCPTCYRLRNEPVKHDDLIDAGLTPKDEIHPVYRALQSLLNAVEDTALAICVADSKDSLRMIRETIADVIVKLETQDTVAQTFLEHFDTRGNR